MKTAECKINKPSLLIEACKLIDQMETSQQNQDVQGDLYEYLLSHLSIAGRTSSPCVNGQFRTPLSLQEEFAGVVARVESLRGRMSESDREASPSGERQVEGLFEALLSESFGD